MSWSASRAVITLVMLFCLTPTSAKAQSVAGHTLPVKGSPNAVVEIVEVGEYECPFCARAQGTLKELARLYPDTVRFTFLHQPLPFHDLALPTALISVVAQEQGKFWEFSELIFAEQRQLSAQNTRAIAARVGLPPARVEEASKSPRIQGIVENQRRVANALGAKGTPSFFVNGTAIKGALGIEAFKRIIDIEVALSGKASASPERAEAYRMGRIKDTNPDLYRFLYAGEMPLPAKAEAAPPKQRVTLSEKEPVYKATVNPTDAARGDVRTALVTLVTFLGYQCVHSGTAMANFNALQERYGDTLRLVIKHLPLSIHTHAEAAAIAAMCAQEQGKFWEMNTHLFANKRLSPAALRGKAKSAGLDLPRWKACIDGGSMVRRVHEDAALGRQIGARGTPISYINGRRVIGALPIEDLRSIIDAEMKRSQALVDAGQSIETLYDTLMKDAELLEPLEETVMTLDMSRAPTRGERTAPVQLVVFTDYQCPYCARLEPALHKLYTRYAGKVAITVKHYPLSFHREARGAAEAAYCAHKQGRFWPMHDGIFQADIQTLDAKVITKIAERIGLDMGHYTDCLAHPGTGAAIDADMAEGQRIGLQGTPTLMFNGRRYDMGFGASVDELAQTVELLLRADQD